MWKQFKCWIDRNWNLLFRRKRCLQIKLEGKCYKHNDVVTNDLKHYYRCLEKQWYILQKPKT